MISSAEKQPFSGQSTLGGELPKPSRPLGRAGKRFFVAVVGAFDVRGWELDLVELAGCQLDRQRQAARRIAKAESERSRGRAEASERAASLCFLKLLKALDLDAEPKTKPTWKRY